MGKTFKNIILSPNHSTLKSLLYVPYIGPVGQYKAIYCQTGIRIGTYNRNFRVSALWCAPVIILCSGVVN